MRCNDTRRILSDDIKRGLHKFQRLCYKLVNLFWQIRIEIAKNLVAIVLCIINIDCVPTNEP